MKTITQKTAMAAFEKLGGIRSAMGTGINGHPRPVGDIIKRAVDHYNRTGNINNAGRSLPCKGKRLTIGNVMGAA